MKIGIIDYGLGNIYSIQRAIQSLGQSVLITDNQNRIMDSDRLILPGVGAFGDAMKKIRERYLDEPILEYARSGRPILGICLGMQLLMSSSEEHGFYEGLNLISGKVVRFPQPRIYGVRYKIPHVGWNQIFPRHKGKAWDGTMLASNKSGDFVYFVHSYIGMPQDTNNVLAVTKYSDVEFCSVVSLNNISGCQFHPELSGDAGLKIYKSFICGKGNL